MPPKIEPRLAEVAKLEKEKRAQRLELKAKAEVSLREFCEQAWQVVEPSTPFIPGWNLDAICEHLQAVSAGQIRNLAINVPPRTAKPVWCEEPVLERTKGRISLGEVDLGDEVLTHRGRFRKVLEIHEQGELPLVAVKTYSGRTIRTAEDHPYLTPRGWVEAGALTEQDVVASVHPTESCGTETVTPEAARLLGYLVGDGCVQFKQINVTNEDANVLADIEHCATSLGFFTTRGKKTNNKAELVRINPLPFGSRWSNKRDGGENIVWEWVKSHDLWEKTSYTKRVPKAIMAATPELIAEFIGAYWSCDGHIQARGRKFENGGRKDCVMGCDTVSEGLARDIQHLLNRLGIYSRIRKKINKIRTVRQGGDLYQSWNITIGTLDQGSKFAAIVKLRHQKKERLLWYVRSAFDKVLNEDAVISVTPDGTGRCRCLTVEEDHSFTANDIAVHNSLFVSVFWPCWEWIHKPEIRWLFSAYTSKLSLRDSMKCRRVIESNWYQQNWGDRFQLIGDQNTKENYENDKTGQRIATSVSGIGVGAGGDRIVCLAWHTRISTDKGKISIRDIVDGKLNVNVLSFDHSSCSLEYQPIISYESAPGRPSVWIKTFCDKEIEPTTDHPFYVKDRGYVAAAELSIGMDLMESDCTTAVVNAVYEIPTPDKVYNIRIAKNHNYFANDILVHNCDDPNNTEEIESDLMRQGVLDWWDHTMSTRGNDPKTVARVIVQQRLHEEDLTGHVLEQGGYTHLCLPMRFERDRRCITTFGGKTWSDPRTYEGEFLWPERFGEKEIAELEKRLGSYMAAGQLQQRPSPAGGGMLKTHWWKYWQPRDGKMDPVPVKMPDGTVKMVAAVELPEKFDNTIMSWDMALKDEKTSDYVVGQVIGAKGANRFVLDQVRDRMDLPKTLLAVRQLSARYPNAHTKLVEDKANGPAVIQSLSSKIGGFIAVNPMGNKISRAAAASPMLEAGNWFLPHPQLFPWVEGFLSELAAFPKGRHDDQCDAWSQSALRLLYNAPVEDEDDATRLRIQAYKSGGWSG